MGFRLKRVVDLLYPDFLEMGKIDLRNLSEDQAQFFRAQLHEYLDHRSVKVKSICLDYLKRDCQRLAKKKHLSAVMQQIFAIINEFDARKLST